MSWKEAEGPRWVRRKSGGGGNSGSIKLEAGSWSRFGHLRWSLEVEQLQMMTNLEQDVGVGG